MDPTYGVRAPAARKNRRPTIRQNPTINDRVSAGEQCPKHGWYLPPREATELRRAATSAGVPTQRARQQLATAERLRRTCPTCGTIRPTLSEWIADIHTRPTAGAN